MSTSAYFCACAAIENIATIAAVIKNRFIVVLVFVYVLYDNEICCGFIRERIFTPFLEFLTEDEVEVASAFLSKHFVETVCPVDTHHTDHRQIDAHTGSGGTLEVERRHVLHVGPCVSAFKEARDRRLWCLAAA